MRLVDIYFMIMVYLNFVIFNLFNNWGNKMRKLLFTTATILAIILIGCGGNGSGCQNGPTVTAISPANGASNVSVTSQIYITFSESVNNVSTLTVRLYALNSNNFVVCTISNVSGNTYVLTPLLGAPLNYSLQYYVAIESDIDNNESVHINPQTFTFTTESMPVGDLWVAGGNSIITLSQDLQAPVVKPPALTNAASWTDADGNLWLFGGLSVSNNYYNILWKYNQYTKTWLHPKTGVITPNQLGIYGTMGIAESTNNPGARSGAMYWTDSEHNFWLYGGYGYDKNGNIGYLNDLWKFNSNNNFYKWTWVAGESTINESAIYGSQNIPAPANTPGARDRGNQWVDNDNNLWIFGGCVYSGSGCSYINDLWKYNPVNNQWTWVGGESSINGIGNYGTKNFESAGNLPSARDAGVTWVDHNGNFWLFGGYNVFGAWNDLWKYSSISGMWTWVGGESSANQAGIYGTKLIPSNNNIPGAREDSIGWVDLDGNLWLFGGSGNDVNGYSGDLNDLWKYNITNKQWTWVSGFKMFGIASNYGTKGIYGGSDVVISAREAMSGWQDQQGNFWLYGGYGYATQSYPASSGYLNDLWMIKPWQ